MDDDTCDAEPETEAEQMSTRSYDIVTAEKNREATYSQEYGKLGDKLVTRPPELQEEQYLARECSHRRYAYRSITNPSESSKESAEAQRE